MLARFRARLTYANVVATLALFIALGGTGYAASQITSSDVKNRSLKGGDVRLNTLTGKEINEGKIGEVPAARQAQNAQNALVASNAATSDLANRATSATSADIAGIARDAQGLAGQGAGAFEKSSRTQFGRAPANPAGTPNEQTLFSWPELGAELRTSVDQCGGSGNASFAVRSTKSSGGGNLAVFNDGDSVPAAVVPAATGRVCASGGDDEVDAEIADASGRTLFVDCLESGGELRCIGFRSEP